MKENVGAEQRETAGVFRDGLAQEDC